jgi:hypothetical protein
MAGKWLALALLKKKKIKAAAQRVYYGFWKK